MRRLREVLLWLTGDLQRACYRLAIGHHQRLRGQLPLELLQLTWILQEWVQLQRRHQRQRVQQRRIDNLL